MHVVIDLTALLPEPTGVDTYLRQLVFHLGLIDHDNHYTILVNYEDRRLFDGVLPRNFAIVPLCFRPRPIRLLLQQVVLPAVARWCGVDVVHSPSFIMPFYRGRPRHVLTVYDMSSFSLPHCHTPLHRSGIYRRAVLASIRRADLVTVPSRFTQQAILNLVPELPPGRVCTITPTSTQAPRYLCIRLCKKGLAFHRSKQWRAGCRPSVLFLRRSPRISRAPRNWSHRMTSKR